MTREAVNLEIGVKEWLFCRARLHSKNKILMAKGFCCNVHALPSGRNSGTYVSSLIP